MKNSKNIFIILFYKSFFIFSFLLILCSSGTFSQTNSKFQIDKNFILKYEVTNRNNIYDFIININRIGKEVEFDWGMSNSFVQKGTIVINNEALKNAISEKNYFRSGNDTLKNQTAVWISQKIFNELKFKNKSEIITKSQPESLSLIRKEFLTLIINDKPAKVEVLYCESDKNSKFWIWNNPASPIIFKMILEFEISIKKIYTSDFISNINTKITAVPDISEELSSTYYCLGYYGEALKLLNLLLVENHRNNNKEKIKELLSRIAECYQKDKGTADDIPKNEPGKYKTDIFNFKISKIFPSAGDTIKALINNGTRDGLFKGATGEIFGVHTKEFPWHGGNISGQSKIIEVNHNSSIAIVNLFSPVNDSNFVIKGDLVNIPIKTIPPDFKSTLYELAKLNIEFTNDNSKLFFHPRQINADYSHSIEDIILNAMVDQIHATAAELLPTAKNNPVYTNINTAGKFKGISMIEGMQQTTLGDMISFLKFVKSFPGKYMGKTWRIDETYATWIINSTPIGEEDLLDSLLLAKDESQIKYLTEKYTKDIKDGAFIEKWNSTAEKSAKDEKIDLAYKINKICVKVSNLLNDRNSLGWAIFSKANILDIDQKTEQCVEIYSEARNIFNETKDIRGISYCTNNIALKYIDLSRFDDALKNFDESIRMKKERFEKEKSNLLYEDIANSLFGKALTLFKLSRYKESLKIYSETLESYTNASTQKGLEQKAKIFGRIADIYEKLGNYKDAIDYNNKSLEQYDEIGDMSGKAYSLNSIGYDYYKLSDYKTAIKYYERAYEINMQNNNKKNAGFSKSSIGQMCWNLGDYNSAIKNHHEAIKLREEANDKSGQAYSWTQIGSLYDKSGDPKNAIEALNQALSLYQLLKDKSGIASTYNSIGDLYCNVKDLKPAIQNYEKSLAIRKEMNTKDEISETLFKIGNVLFDDKNYPKAKEYYQQSFAIRKEIGDKAGQVNCLANIGLVIQINDNDFKSAEKYYNDALNLAKEIGSKSDIAFCLKKLGRLFDARGDYKSSLEHYNSSLKIYQEIGDKGNEALLLLDVGSIYTSKGEFEKSLELYQRAFLISDSTKNRINTAIANNYIGEIHSLFGEYKKALEIQEKSLNINIEVKNDWGIASSYISLGNIYNSMGEYKKAIDFYNMADSIYKLIGNELSQATPINNIGTIYFWQGDHDKAMAQFEKALKILQKSNFEGEFLSIIKSNIGEILYEKKSYKEALKWLNEALSISKKSGSKRIYASTLSIIGKTNLSQKNYESAKKNIEEAYQLTKEMKEQDRIAETAGLLGKVLYEKKDMQNASKFLQESIKISKSIGSNRFLWEPLYTLALISKEKNNTNDCILNLKESIKVMSEIREKIAGGENAQKLFSKGELKAKIYEELVSLLIQNNDIDGALQYLENSNNDGLKEQFGKLDIKFNDENKNKALLQEKDLKTKLDGMNEQIVKEKSKPESRQNKSKIDVLERSKTITENEYTKFINETIKGQPDLANHFRKNVNPIELRKVKRQIPDDIAVIAYLIGEKQLYIFVATSDTIVAKVIEIQKSQLDSKIDYLYNILKNPLSSNELNTRTLQPEEKGKTSVPNFQIKSFKKFSEELYDILISSIISQIENKKKLAIIPNGELFYMPFQVLGKTREDGSFDFLGTQKSIFYISSLNMFFSPKSEKSTNLKILAFGNADNSLPNSEIEVKDIQSIYPDARVFIKETATKDKVINMPGDFNSIHFATHGNLDYGNFQNSYLTLAPGKTGDNGRLTLEEIWQITNLYDCKMVTLSACNTAVGGETIQGWLVNPANAFLDAGVQSVIATLWQVNDSATSLLMKEFYQNLKKMDKVEALRKAQESLIKNPKYVDPYYWAAFVLVGDWR